MEWHGHGSSLAVRSFAFRACFFSDLYEILLQIDAADVLLLKLFGKTFAKWNFNLKKNGNASSKRCSTI